MYGNASWSTVIKLKKRISALHVSNIPKFILTLHELAEDITELGTICKELLEFRQLLEKNEGVNELYSEVNALYSEAKELYNELTELYNELTELYNEVTEYDINQKKDYHANLTSLKPKAAENTDSSNRGVKLQYLRNSDITELLHSAIQEQIHRKKQEPSLDLVVHGHFYEKDVCSALKKAVKEKGNKSPDEYHTWERQLLELFAHNIPKLEPFMKELKSGTNATRYYLHFHLYNAMIGAELSPETLLDYANKFEGLSEKEWSSYHPFLSSLYLEHFQDDSKDAKQAKKYLDGIDGNIKYNAKKNKMSYQNLSKVGVMKNFVAQKIKQRNLNPQKSQETENDIINQLPTQSRIRKYDNDRSDHLRHENTNFYDRRTMGYNFDQKWQEYFNHLEKSGKNLKLYRVYGKNINEKGVDIGGKAIGGSWSPHDPRKLGEAYIYIAGIPSYNPATNLAILSIPLEKFRVLTDRRDATLRSAILFNDDSNDNHDPSNEYGLPEVFFDQQNCKISSYVELNHTFSPGEKTQDADKGKKIKEVLKKIIRKLDEPALTDEEYNDIRIKVMNVIDSRKDTTEERADDSRNSYKNRRLGP